ncbi:hypothetical protein MHU86_25548 [Fragilaria crotonensis]|nr:hypothetical protein MHU86_25548 [Fragilaria crotonensis]
MKWTSFLIQAMSLACILVPATGTTTAFLVKSMSPTCAGDFELTDFEFTCGDECVVGSTVDVSGALASETGFAEYQQVTVNFCPLDYDWSCYSYNQFQTNICDSLVALDGQECPSPGNYTFEFHFDLPGGDGQSWYWYWSFKLSAVFLSSDSSTSCSVGLQPSQSKYQMVWSFAGVALVASAIFVGSVRRRRRVVTREQVHPGSSIEGIEFQRMEELSVRPGVMI